MRIIIETIAHKDQRYPTVGDWAFDTDGTLHIKVSNMGNSNHEILVAIHELVEAALCTKRGITDEVVTAFDEQFEIARSPEDMSEPGDHPLSPYRQEHCIATAVERLMCAELGIPWFDYDQAIQRLG